MPGPSGVPAQLVSLDPSPPGFLEDLRRLDQLPSRHRDSAFVFCMRAGQRTAAEVILPCLSVTLSSCLLPPHVSLCHSFMMTSQLRQCFEAVTLSSVSVSVDPEQRRVQQQRPVSLPGLPVVSRLPSEGGATTNGRSQHQYVRSVLHFVALPGVKGYMQSLCSSRAAYHFPEFPAALGDSGGGVFNGERFVLMYADALTELTFIVPSSSSHSQSLYWWM